MKYRLRINKLKSGKYAWLIERNGRPTVYVFLVEEYPTPMDVCRYLNVRPGGVMGQGGMRFDPGPIPQSTYRVTEPVEEEKNLTASL